MDSRTLAIAPADMRLPVPPEAGLPPGILENRYLILSWPARVRLGDVAFIRLTLVVDAQERLTSGIGTANASMNSRTQQVQDIYDTHRVLAEARLELAGVRFIPTGEISVALLPGRPVAFLWSISPDRPGVYDGTVWLHLRFIPLEGGEELRSVLSAQPIELEATSLLGLGGSGARLLGGLGVAFFLAFGLSSVVARLVAKKKLEQNL
jgi:hypothetical protein